jgi:hypothetical protein
MKYNLIRTSIGEKNISFIECKEKPYDLDVLLNQIQSAIIDLYEKKQNNEAGIKKLGNEIRYSNILNSYFENKDSTFYVIKFTENNRYFLSKFIEVVMSGYSNDIYFFILENDFGKESKLVDNSFIRFNQVKQQLISFFDFFNPKVIIPTVYFIEVKGFSNYFFEERNGYNFIHKNI